MSIELTTTDAAELARLLAAGDVTSADVTRAYLDRIAAEDGELGAYLHVDAESALARAGELDAAGSAGTGLTGIPVALKDVVVTEGVPTTSGSKILEGWRPPYDATVAARLKAAGTVLLGKTNMDEFAMGSSTENSAYRITRNPWDLERIPGGSSGGSAAAVAGGLAPWAIGTDTGGSIRQPAALTGIVGLKPTYGAVSRYGMIAFASSLDQAGPFTRDVADAALLFSKMVGRDPCDSTSLAFPEEVRAPSAERLDGIRLGMPSELSGEGIEPGVLDAFKRTLALAEELGATIEECSLPHAPHALSAYYVLAPAEASSNLARYDGVRYGLRRDDGNGLVDMYTQTRHDGFGPEVKRRILIGTYALSSGYYDAYYGRAQQVRTKISEDFITARLDPLRHKARLLIEKFDSATVWGWKDPRNSLTLPFWQQLLPRLKTIVVVRNPLEVAHSMRERNGTSYSFGLRLWEIYNRRVIETADTQERLVTHYDLFFDEPETELRRIT
ncbi:MAG: amidase family protein, partial [Blastococcus sp.]